MYEQTSHCSVVEGGIREVTLQYDLISTAEEKMQWAQISGGEPGFPR